VRRAPVIVLAVLLAYPFLVDAAYRVSGTVTDYLRQAPARNYCMRLQGLSPNTKTDSSFTDISGNFAFNEVPAGTYKVSVTGGWYLPDSAFATINGDTSISFFALEKAHTLVKGDIPDTLTKEGSPYIVLGTVLARKPLFVNAGARVLFLKAAQLRLSNVSAIGSQTDSVVFAAAQKDQLDSNSGRLIIDEYQGTFAYCLFDHLFSIEVRFNPHYLSFEHCLFNTMQTVLSLKNSIPLRKIKLADNRMLYCINGILGINENGAYTDTFELTDNVIQCSGKTMYLGGVRNNKNFVRRNTVLGSTVFNAQSVTANDTITSNIFTNLSFYNAGGKSVFFAYNDILALNDTPPQGIGTATRVNARGDSCDYFHNIRANPLFLDSSSVVLLNTSRCIGAGFKGENIGAYQGKGEDTLSPRAATRPGSFKVLSVRKEAAGTFLSVAGFFGGSERYQPAIVLYEFSGKRCSDKVSLAMNDKQEAGTATIHVARQLPLGNYLLEIRRLGRYEVAQFTVTK
jgi:hypothetical protein